MGEHFEFIAGEKNLFRHKKYPYTVIHSRGDYDRVIAIGDIHGCIDELKELWELLGPKPSDLVISLGDLVDRGPDSEGVVQFVKQHGIKMVLGNHDEKVIRYHWHALNKQDNPEYKIPMNEPKSYHLLSLDSLAFLAEAPHAIWVVSQGPTMYFVHSGLHPVSKFSQQAKAFIRNRYFLVDDQRHLQPAKSTKINGVWHVPEGSLPWFYFWHEPNLIVYGHIANDEPVLYNNTIGIDGGCCYGKNLIAWIQLEDKMEAFAKIKAHKIYKQEKIWNID